MTSRLFFALAVPFAWQVLGLLQILLILWMIAYVLGMGGWADFVPRAITDLGAYWPFVYNSRFIDLNRGGVGAVAAIVLLLLCVTQIAAGFLVVPHRVLHSTFVFSMSHLYRTAGLALAGAGIYLRVLGSSGGSTLSLLAQRLSMSAIAAGAAMLVVGTVGINCA
jgi:hypothetical protein